MHALNYNHIHMTIPSENWPRGLHSSFDKATRSTCGGCFRLSFPGLLTVVHVHTQLVCVSDCSAQSLTQPTRAIARVVEEICFYVLTYEILTARLEVSDIGVSGQASHRKSGEVSEESSSSSSDAGNVHSLSAHEKKVFEGVQGWWEQASRHDGPLIVGRPFSSDHSSLTFNSEGQGTVLLLGAQRFLSDVARHIRDQIEATLEPIEQFMAHAKVEQPRGHAANVLLHPCVSAGAANIIEKCTTECNERAGRDGRPTSVAALCQNP